MIITQFISGVYKIYLATLKIYLTALKMALKIYLTARKPLVAVAVLWYACK